MLESLAASKGVSRSRGPQSLSLVLAGCQNRFGIPFWLVGEFTTLFRAYFSGWIGMFIGGTGF